MTDEERLKILHIIENRIDIQKNKGEVLRLSNLRMIMENSGISPTLYNGFQLKAWLKANFPELEIEGGGGQEYIVKTDKILECLINALEKRNGILLMSDVSPILAEIGIKWRELARGKTLPKWLKESYPEFVVSQNLLYLKIIVFLCTKVLL